MKPKLKGEEVLEVCAASLLPLVRYCLLEGVNYPLFVRALKPVFVQAAKLELEKGEVKINDSSVSMMSGLHRKDVRELSNGHGDSGEISGSIASLLFTKWVSDPRYVLKSGKPRRLLKNGPAPSFESLARSITRDVHPGAILKAMQAQGMVRCDRDGKGKAMRIALVRESFVPQDDLSELLKLFAANLQDHLYAATSNLRGVPPPFLEQAVFGSGLSKASVDKLAKFTRSHWAKYSLELIKLANQLYAGDKNTAEPFRFRLGNYFYSTPIAPDGRRATSSQSETGK
ncbi:MAG: DUF6502 family protein [Betaproteobacteria bacterium]|nr:DUF6502 family protein [Betaproteobacteria bacterium]